MKIRIDPLLSPGLVTVGTPVKLSWLAHLLQCMYAPVSDFPNEIISHFYGGREVPNKSQL